MNLFHKTSRLSSINRYISWVTNRIYFRLENDIINIYNDTDIGLNYVDFTTVGSIMQKDIDKYTI